MKWREALKTYNEIFEHEYGIHKVWAIPKKGTEQMANIRQLMEHGSEKAKKLIHSEHVAEMARKDQEPVKGEVTESKVKKLIQNIEKKKEKAKPVVKEIVEKVNEIVEVKKPVRKMKVKAKAEEKKEEPKREEETEQEKEIREIYDKDLSLIEKVIAKPELFDKMKKPNKRGLFLSISMWEHVMDNKGESQAYHLMKSRFDKITIPKNIKLEYLDYKHEKK